MFSHIKNTLDRIIAVGWQWFVSLSLEFTLFCFLVRFEKKIRQFI